jgi:hypothetical protein
MKKYKFLSIPLVFAIFIATGCSKKNGTMDPADYSGSWTGTTSQGKSISFTVSGETVSNIYIGYCSPSPVASQLYSNFPINGKSFSTTGSIKIAGSFSSSNEAGGSFSIDFTGNPPGCSSTASGTWIASK